MTLFSSAFGCSILLLPATMFASEGAAGPDQTICGTATVMQADPPGSGDQGTWSIVSGAGVFADAHGPFTQVSGLAPGENVFQWSVVGDGPPELDQVIITVHDPAATVAFAGPDSILCAPVDTMQLMATPAISPAIGSWSSVGIALIDVFTQPNSFVEFPSGGNVQMIWTVFNGVCGQASDTALISVQDCVIGLDERSADPAPALVFDPGAGTIIVRHAQAGDQLELIDQSGRSVFRTTLRTGDQQVPLRGAMPGAYLVRLSSSKRAVVLCIVLDR